MAGLAYGVMLSPLLSWTLTVAGVQMVPLLFELLAGAADRWRRGTAIAPK